MNQAKVFKAHAVPQGLCGNLINALKLLANRQEDGYGLIQNFVTNLGVRSRKGLTQGLREFRKIDNQRALEVGYLSHSEIQRTKAERVRRLPIGDGQDELTLRAEEVGTWK